MNWGGGRREDHMLCQLNIHCVPKVCGLEFVPMHPVIIN